MIASKSGMLYKLSVSMTCLVITGLKNRIRIILLRKNKSAKGLLITSEPQIFE